jgi:hypothetical protein
MPKTKLCKHKLAICHECIYITDAGKRMADIINGLLAFHNAFEIRNKWMAFNLATGESDGTLYDSRLDAITHQLDERFYCYFAFKSCTGGVKALDCQIYLEVQRQAYDSGMRLYEPEAPQLILPTDWYDRKVKNIKGPMRMDGGQY